MSNENKIRVLYVQPGKYPEERVIEHTLAAMQALVGGDIEAVYPWEDNACVVCDDEGKLKRKPLNLVRKWKLRRQLHYYPLLEKFRRR